MKTVEIYEIGETVLIKASVTDITIDQGKIKYRLRVEHTNNDLEHTFTENQMQPMPVDAKSITCEKKPMFVDAESITCES